MEKKLSWCIHKHWLRTLKRGRGAFASVCRERRAKVDSGLIQEAIILIIIIIKTEEHSILMSKNDHRWHINAMISNQSDKRQVINHIFLITILFLKLSIAFSFPVTLTNKSTDIQENLCPLRGFVTFLWQADYRFSVSLDGVTGALAIIVVTFNEVHYRCPLLRHHLLDHVDVGRRRVISVERDVHFLQLLFRSFKFKMRPFLWSVEWYIW